MYRDTEATTRVNHKTVTRAPIHGALRAVVHNLAGRTGLSVDAFMKETERGVDLGPCQQNFGPELLGQISQIAHHLLAETSQPRNGSSRSSVERLAGLADTLHDELGLEATNGSRSSVPEGQSQPSMEPEVLQEETIYEFTGIPAAEAKQRRIDRMRHREVMAARATKQSPRERAIADFGASLSMLTNRFTGGKPAFRDYHLFTIERFIAELDIDDLLKLREKTQEAFANLRAANRGQIPKSKEGCEEQVLAMIMDRIAWRMEQRAGNSTPA